MKQPQKRRSATTMHRVYINQRLRTTTNPLPVRGYKLRLHLSYDCAYFFFSIVPHTVLKSSIIASVFFFALPFCFSKADATTWKNEDWTRTMSFSSSAAWNVSLSLLRVFVLSELLR